MCGIVGLISRRTNGFYGSDLDMMEGLLILDTLRGMDSTGAFCIHGSKKISLVKHASHPLHTFKTEEWNRWRSGAVSTGKIIIGHNRKATQGSINSENAHPFIENHIVLVHNGTLRGHKELADKDVDSHAVCHAFAEKGAENVLPEIDGAFAFVWWDSKKERLFAVRNDERPLAIVLTDDVLAIASEPWMPTALFSRNGRKVTETIIIEPGDLYSFGLDGKYTTEKVKLKKPEPANYTVYRQPGCANDACADRADELEDWYDNMGEGWGRRHAVVPFRTRQDRLADVSSITRQTAIEESRAAEAPAILRPRGTPILDEHFKVGEDTLVEFHRFSQPNADQRVQAFGKVVAPGKPSYDVVCWMPSHVDIADGSKWQRKPIVATIGMVHGSNCGPSLWVNTPRFPKQIQTNNDLITEQEWQEVCTKHVCNCCGAKIFEEEALFTTVTKHYGGRFRITCADCVADKLPEGEMKNEFIKRRSAALQTGEQFSAATVTIPDNQAGQEGTPTVH